MHQSVTLPVYCAVFQNNKTGFIPEYVSPKKSPLGCREAMPYSQYSKGKSQTGQTTFAFFSWIFLLYGDGIDK